MLLSLVVVAFAGSTFGGGHLRFDAQSPRWAAVIASAADPERAQRCLGVFAGRVTVPADLEPAAEVLAWAAGTTRDAASTEGLVTPIQGARALSTLATAPAQVRALVRELVDDAGSTAEKALILKAVAARARSLDAPSFESDLRAFASTIRGKPLRWLLENTTTYGTSFGGGIKQSWKDSCMPAIKLLAEAEADPVAALAMHATPTALSDEERHELESFGGVAVPREDLGHGRGTRDHELLFKMASELDEKIEVIERSDLTAQHLDRMEVLLLEGVDLPLRIATAANTVAHSVIVVDAKRDNGKRLFRVHDPWTGISTWFDDDAFLTGWLIPTDHGEPRRVTHLYLSAEP